MIDRRGTRSSACADRNISAAQWRFGSLAVAASLDTVRSGLPGLLSPSLGNEEGESDGYDGYRRVTGQLALRTTVHIACSQGEEWR